MIVHPNYGLVKTKTTSQESVNFKGKDDNIRSHEMKCQIILLQIYFLLNCHETSK